MSAEARACPISKAASARFASGGRVRRRRSIFTRVAALGGAIALSGIACARTEPARDPGASSAWTTAQPPASPPPIAAEPAPAIEARPWELAIDRLRVAAHVATSQHSHGELTADVLVNDGAAMYPALGPATTLAEGALLVEAERDASAAPPRLQGYLLMRKREAGFDARNGDWEYGIADANGKLRERGILPGCARCHADAPHDHLFGVAGAAR